MTIQNDVVLWDNGIDKFYLYSVPDEQQYKCIDGIPCLTFGIAYENSNYRGCDIFALFDHFYVSKMHEIKDVYSCLNGAFRIDDNGADTDGYVDFLIKNGRVLIKGQLGSSFSEYSLNFEVETDQTILIPLLKALTI